MAVTQIIRASNGHFTAQDKYQVLQAGLQEPNTRMAVQATVVCYATKLMSRKGPEVGQGMLDFLEDLRYDVVLH